MWWYILFFSVEGPKPSHWRKSSKSDKQGAPLINLYDYKCKTFSNYSCQNFKTNSWATTMTKLCINMHIEIYLKKYQKAFFDKIKMVVLVSRFILGPTSNRKFVEPNENWKIKRRDQTLMDEDSLGETICHLLRNVGQIDVHLSANGN